MSSRITEKDLGYFLEQGEPELGRLVEHLRPILHTRVARVLLRRGQCSTHRLHEEIQELIQEMFLLLFERDAYVLRGWDPQLGTSLENYVGLVAERRVASILRDRGRMKRAAEPEPIGDEGFEPSDPAEGPGADLEHRQMLGLLLGRVKESLSQSAWGIFEMRFIRDLDIEEIRVETGMASDAIYASISRSRRVARDLKSEIEGRAGS